MYRTKWFGNFVRMPNCTPVFDVLSANLRGGVDGGSRACRLKGPATSIDVVTILKTVNTINARVNQLGAHFDKQFPHSGARDALYVGTAM
eukprot:5310373-Amphidinium_carterae.1